MDLSRSIAAWVAVMGIVMAPASSRASGAMLAPHPEVTGPDIALSDVRRQGGAWAPTAWADLTRTTFEPGRYELRVRAASDERGDAIQIPQCAGRGAVRVDSRVVSNGPGPVVVPVTPGPHEVVLEIDVSRYERRIACGEAVRVGPVQPATDGLGTLRFDSPHAARGGGQAVVYVPPGFDLHATGQVLVGLHPWNGSIWTYAAYEELLREARARGVVLLMPSGLGNSLYTADAEDEVLLAIDALASVAGEPGSFDAARAWNVSIWGASMGGAGATTIAFHHPDLFAAVTSFFGDSKYDLSTYVRSILVTERRAHEVNALDVVDNARNLPVWLIHGEADVTSPIRQSQMLADAMRERGYTVRFDRIADIGHSGALVARFLAEVVDAAARARTERHPARITYRSVRRYACVYGIYIERQDPLHDAFIDLEQQGNSVHWLRGPEGVSDLRFAPTVMRTCQRP
jgi:pimeloyl-ACP methyl ester carboxylesterase